MEESPFTELEWQQVRDAGNAIVNASLQDDDVLGDSLFAELSAVLHELRQRYGNHPILLETEADFCDDPSVQRDMYRLAIQLAETNALPTLTIRMSLANVLLTDFNDPMKAVSELKACEPELATKADEWDVQKWFELMRQCEERCPSSLSPNTTTNPKDANAQGNKSPLPPSNGGH
jgi:hypothetical protein